MALWRERGEDLRVADGLRPLLIANGQLGLHKEGIEQAKEALAIYERHNHTSGQARSLQFLAWSLNEDQQFDAAEEAALRAIDLSRDNGNQFTVCECHRILGIIYRLKGETGKAITHYETALGIASSFNWHHQLHGNHFSLAWLFLGENRFDEAQAHIERAKSHTTNYPYGLGHAVEMQAMICYKQCRFEEAKSEALGAADVFGKLGAIKDAERCRALLQKIEDTTSD